MIFWKGERKGVEQTFDAGEIRKYIIFYMGSLGLYGEDEECFFNIILHDVDDYFFINFFHEEDKILSIKLAFNF